MSNIGKTKRLVLVTRSQLDQGDETCVEQVDAADTIYKWGKRPF